MQPTEPNKSKRKRAMASPTDLTHSIPIEDLVQSPLPGFVAPSSLTFSLDNSLILHLFSSQGTLNRNIFSFDVLNNGKQELVFGPPNGGGVDDDSDTISAEEKLRRERSRELGLGVTKYEWVKCRPGIDKKIIMVPLPTGIYFQDLSCSQPELKLPCTSSSPIIEPHVSPDGTMLSYVRDYDLHVLNLSNGESIPVTSGGGKSLTHGLAEYVAQEEMERKNGYWWSTDSKYIAFTQVDSSHIPLYRIMHQGKGYVGSDAQEDHAYPFTGTSNVKVKLAVVSASGGPITWMDLLCGGGQEQTSGDEEYLGRINWMPGNVLVAQIVNRSHTKLKILKFDIETGKRTPLYIEENDVWINIHDCFTPLDHKGGTSLEGYIWASEKSGFKHLYLHDKNGVCLGPITEGEWMVEQITGVNETAGLVYFTGTVDGPLESNLYCTTLFPDWNHRLPVPKRLTLSNGRHVVVLDHQMQRFVDIYDSLNAPPTVSLRSLLDGSLITILYDQPTIIPRFRSLTILPPEIIEIPASDGSILYGALYRPDEKRFGAPPYKTCICVYGGPGAQIVCNSWRNTMDMTSQYLRNKGILVWKLDNRGSLRRGLKFESFLKYGFGRIDAEDQLTGAEWLINKGLAKPGQVGIYGWSYGGYLSAITLSRFPETFQFAVCGAPPTAWDGYDTFYTEKYMGFPSEHPAEYEYASVMHHVKNIKGKLLLVHGMLDENVHFRHTARLLNEFIAARKPYELLIFPDARHFPRPRKDLIYLQERIMEFIERNH